MLSPPAVFLSLTDGNLPFTQGMPFPNATKGIIGAGDDAKVYIFF